MKVLCAIVASKHINKQQRSIKWCTELKNKKQTKQNKKTSPWADFEAQIQYYVFKRNLYF